MQISKDKVVTFHYKLFEGSEMLEDSGNSDPMLYMHGRKGLFQGLEDALEGKQTGGSVEVTLTPEQAYGERQDSPFQRVPVKHLMPKKKKPRVGEVFQVNTQDGARQVVIKKVGKFNVDVDTNHPLAGKTLRFEIVVTDVREATEEERAHGHAHGAGGHQH
jgi:FKBP-type peptidyl-prolyl cis-trans isomerase SlyD